MILQWKKWCDNALCTVWVDRLPRVLPPNSVTCKGPDSQGETFDVYHCGSGSVFKLKTLSKNVSSKLSIFHQNIDPRRKILSVLFLFVVDVTKQKRWEGVHMLMQITDMVNQNIGSRQFKDLSILHILNGTVAVSISRDQFQHQHTPILCFYLSNRNK